MRKGFTIIELLVAVGVLGLLVAFSGYIFEVSIDSQRTAGANTEIMDKLRVICDQLNADFGEIRTDGYLVLQSRVSDRYEYKEDELNNEPNLFHDDKLYYFSTGDYQSWFDEGVESNTARIYFGHDSSSIYDNTLRPYVSEWSLARDVLLLTPGIIVTGLDDCIDLSFTKFKKDVLKNNLDDVWGMFEDNPPLRVRIDIANPSYADDVRRLMCENVGEIKIEWTDGTAYEEPPTGSNIYMLAWFGFDMQRKDGDADLPGSVNPVINGLPVYGPDSEDPVGLNIETELFGSPLRYRAIWRPYTDVKFWPKALRFTFTIYDSNGVIRGGRRFTHIVVLGN